MVGKVARAPAACALSALAALSLGGCVSIYSASASGSDRSVDRMIAAGVSPNLRSPEGTTPLLVAVINGRLSTVKLLLSRGAAPNAPNAKGATPLAYAVEKHLPEVAEALIAGGARVDGIYDGDGNTPLLMAVSRADLAMIELLAAHGVSFSVKNSSGDDALTLALRAGRIDVLQAVLRHGADPNEPDETGQTPVEFATYANRADLVAALQAFGARPIGVQGRLGLSLAAAKDGAVAVAGVVSGSPAADAGIAAGDLFLDVNGESTAGWPLRKIADRLRGAPGTYAALTLQRTYGVPTTYTLTRQAVGLPSAAPLAGAPAPAANAAPAPVSDVDWPVERAAPREDDFALVIGIEDYESVPRAEYALRDARAMRRHLAALGWPERNIVSLEGPAATKSKLESYLDEWLPLNVKPDTTLFVYYSGHGSPDPANGDAYLVPWDGDPEFLKSTAYPLRRLYAELSKLKVRRVVVALDACFSGEGGRSVLAKGARPLVSSSAAGLPKAGNVAVLAAAEGDEITGALDSQGHGMFTYYLLKALSGGARDARGGVTAREAFDYLEPRVASEARRQNRVQKPTFDGADDPSPLARYRPFIPAAN
ncbi:MAG TPA: ankyrin repeat domain-containing protein [Elusimicrobiota bacterium]|nr:ankyrin repeat domain-containing protein [Elusimicrobiota bacterium]